jgi:hypothetical protein
MKQTLRPRFWPRGFLFVILLSGHGLLIQAEEKKDPFSRGAVAKSDVDWVPEKLRSIILSKVELNEVTLSQAVGYLQREIGRLDVSDRKDFSKNRIQLVVRVQKDQPEKVISLSLNQVPLEVALQKVAELAGAQYRVDGQFVVLDAVHIQKGNRVTKSYAVPKGVLEKMAVASQNTDPLNCRQILEAHGISFGQGAFAAYDPANGRLVMTNTPENMDLLDQLLEQVGSKPSGFSKSNPLRGR